MNVYYTKVTQDIDALLYNTKFDVDAGGTFKFNQNISAGISLVYGFLKGGYENIGFKPMISASLFKRCVLEANGDVRKNISLSNPIFNQFINMSCSIKYTIK
jgi:hypothetical protein